MFDQARPLLSELLGSYPSSRFLLWSKAKLDDAQGRYADAANVYATLSGAYATIGAHRNIAAALSQHAHMVLKSGDLDSSMRVCNRVIGRYGSCGSSAARDACALCRKLINQGLRYGNR
jgi:predicted Zn-dependent protease